MGDSDCLEIHNVGKSCARNYYVDYRAKFLMLVFSQKIQKLGSPFPVGSADAEMGRSYVCE